MTGSGTPEKNKGPLGPWMSLSLVIGTMIGGGIFLLPASLAPLGWNAALGWLVSGVGAVTLAISFRYLMDSSGQGIQHNIERVLGELPGFLALWAYWIAGFPSMAALAIAGVQLLLPMIVPDASRTLELSLATATIWLLVAVNIVGTRSAGRLQLASVLIKLIPLIGIVALAAWALAGSQPTLPVAPAPISFDNVATAVALTLFALLGFEAATIPVGKVRNPGRNIAIALIGGTVFVVLLYLLVSTGIMLVMPWQEVASSASPFSDALGGAMGPLAVVLVSICIVISLIGCCNGLMLIQGEIVYAMALRSEVPQMLGQTNSRGVAHLGMILSGALTTFLIALNSSRGTLEMFTFFVLLTAGGVLVFYALALLAAVKENRFARRLPVMALAAAFLLLATYGTGLESSLWVLALLAAGLLTRWLSSRGRAVIDRAATG